MQELRSDLRSESKQLRIGISPQTFSQRYNWSLNYTIADVREQYRGFQSTTGNPRDVAWSRAGGVRVAPPDHVQPVLQLLRRRARELVRPVSAAARRSRRPSRATSTATATPTTARSSSIRTRRLMPRSPRQMQALIDDSSGSARECLAQQLGRLAERNSCRGPWTTNANLNISFNPLKVRLPQRATLSFSVSNPLGAADLLLHGRGQAARLGPADLRRSDAACTCAASTAGDAAVQVRGQSAVRQRQPAVQRVPRADHARPCRCVWTSARRASGSSSRRCSTAAARRRARRCPSSSCARSIRPGGLLNPMAQLLRSMDTLGLVGWQADSIASMNRAIHDPARQHLEPGRARPRCPPRAL